MTLRDRLLISTLHHIERDAYFEPSAKNLFEGAMQGMMATLSEEYEDDYSMYIPPSSQTDYLDRHFNRYEGLGFSLGFHEESPGEYGEDREEKKGSKKKFFINYPFYESPVYRACLRSGDQILQINGTLIADKTPEEVMELLKPPEQSEVLLTVLPFGQTESKDFIVRREKIQSDSIEGDYFHADKRIFCLETMPKIGYIRITSFRGATTANEFGNALDSMMQSGAESLILDLRDNGGGDVWECVQIARMLMSPKPDLGNVPDSGNVIVTVRNRNGFRRSLVLSEEKQRCTLPMVVLINGDTASASEFLTVALQDHRRASIVGNRSFGKGVGQGIFGLPFQSGLLSLTDWEYRRPNGKAIHRKKYAADSDDWGVIPDKIVEISDAEKLAVMEYRSLRSNVISPQRLAVLEQFRQQMIKQKAKEQNGEFRFTGTAPYYDVQLDEAIKTLTHTP